MPEKILELLKMSSLTEKQLATKLHISLDEVKACINHLYMTGFIRPVGSTDPSCGAGCPGCDGTCGSAKPSYKIWKISN